MTRKPSLTGSRTLLVERRASSSDLEGQNRHGGVEELAVDRRRTPELANRLLVIAFAVSVIGFMVLPLTRPALAAVAESLTSERVTSPAAVPRMPPLARPGDHRAPVAVASDSLLAFPTLPASSPVDRDARRGQGDARLYLRDASGAAHRYPWAGPGTGETRTDLWLNAPESIASTSPPVPSPVNASMDE